MIRPMSEAHWSSLSKLIENVTGLHFSPARRQEFERGMRNAARDFQFDDDVHCMDWLLSKPLTDAQVQVLARHLTVGETYFYRDPALLELLEERVLPSLIHARRGGRQQLRLWSAGCCTGEEAYMLAILLWRQLPDLRDWDITVLGTDLNRQFLLKAEAGLYGDWSFRGAPTWLDHDYFRGGVHGLRAIRPEIRRLVEFRYQNLAQASAAGGLDIPVMDVIVCRNVLMYLSPVQMARVVERLYRHLNDGGWLVVSPSEASPALFVPFVPEIQGGAALFRKQVAASDSGFGGGHPANAAAAGIEGSNAERSHPPLARSEGEVGTQVDPIVRAKALADGGLHTDALAWCELSLTDQRLNAAGHYLRAMILVEQCNPAEARVSLQRTLYLDLHFVMAHFALGNLERSSGNEAEAMRHYRNAKRLLEGYGPRDPLAEADGICAGDLAGMLQALCDVGEQG